MKSVLLQAATYPIVCFQILLSLYLLLRGHNSPGGGFIAGLIASASFALVAISYEVEKARRLMLIKSRTLTAAGLLLAFGSGIWSLLLSKAFLTGVWNGSFSLPPVGKIAIGTPLFFDIGVFLAVVGVTTEIIFLLLQKPSASSAKDVS